MATAVIVTGIPEGTPESELTAVFAEFGTIVHQYSLSPTVMIIDYESHENAKEALDLNDISLGSFTVGVQLYEGGSSRRPQPPQQAPPQPVQLPQHEMEQPPQRKVTSELEVNDDDIARIPSIIAALDSISRRILAENNPNLCNLLDASYAAHIPGYQREGTVNRQQKHGNQNYQHKSHQQSHNHHHHQHQQQQQQQRHQQHHNKSNQNQNYNNQRGGQSGNSNNNQYNNNRNNNSKNTNRNNNTNKRDPYGPNDDRERDRAY